MIFAGEINGNSLRNQIINASYKCLSLVAASLYVGSMDRAALNASTALLLSPVSV